MKSKNAWNGGCWCCLVAASLSAWWWKIPAPAAWWRKALCILLKASQSGYFVWLSPPSLCSSRSLHPIRRALRWLCRLWFQWRNRWIYRQFPWPPLLLAVLVVRLCCQLPHRQMLSYSPPAMWNKAIWWRLGCSSICLVSRLSVDFPPAYGSISKPISRQQKGLSLGISLFNWTCHI